MLWTENVRTVQTLFRCWKSVKNIARWWRESQRPSWRNALAMRSYRMNTSMILWWRGNRQHISWHSSSGRQLCRNTVTRASAEKTSFLAFWKAFHTMFGGNCGKSWQIPKKWSQLSSLHTDSCWSNLVVNLSTLLRRMFHAPTSAKNTVNNLKISLWLIATWTPVATPREWTLSSGVYCSF